MPTFGPSLVTWLDLQILIFLERVSGYGVVQLIRESKLLDGQVPGLHILPVRVAQASIIVDSEATASRGWHCLSVECGNFHLNPLERTNAARSALNPVFVVPGVLHDGQAASFY